jgi:phosphoribosyl 1,2-cyclic phosphate phosphodiesterase
VKPINASFQVLGCGTSTGVPLPGCRCEVCLSTNPRNKRSRCSGVLKFSSDRDLNGAPLNESVERRILIDASTDLRSQALTFDLRRVDAVIFTHAHADHILGVEDLRAFNFVQRQQIPCFASLATNAELRRFYSYIFSPSPDYEGGGLAQLSLTDIVAGRSFSLFGVEILPFELFHGRMPVFGFRIGDFAYATDCSRIPTESVAHLQALQTLILDGLRYEAHPTHFTIPQACEVAAGLKVKQTYLTHMTHTVNYLEVSPKLPNGIALAHDGLEFAVTI